MRALVRESRALFPHWPRARRHRWIRAALRARSCKPSYGRLLPLTEEQMTTVGAVLAPRTLRESGL